MSEKHRLDGRAVTVIRAPADQLWTLVSDVTRAGEWSPENVGGMWLDGATAPVVGARFKGTNHRGRTKWATTCEVIVAVPGRELAFVTGTSAKPQTRWRYLFQPLGDGETRVTESFEFAKPLGPISRLVTRITIGVRDRRSDLEQNVRVSLENLKRIAEG